MHIYKKKINLGAILNVTLITRPRRAVKSFIEDLEINNVK